MTTPDPAALEAVESQSFARDLRKRLPPAAADISIQNIAVARQRHESWEKRFGSVVRGWRLDRSWSQEDVAEKLRQEGFEMHQTTIAKIERGTRPLRVAEATAIASIFEMPVMSVFDLSQPGDRPGWASERLEERQEMLDKARALSDQAREKLYGAAYDHAYFLGEIEKLVQKMNQESAERARNDSET